MPGSLQMPVFGQGFDPFNGGLMTPGALWNAVIVPEPASFCLLSVAGLGLLRLRLRWR